MGRLGHTLFQPSLYFVSTGYNPLNSVKEKRIDEFN